MSGFAMPHKSKKHAVCIHIGSGSVALGLVDYSAKKPTIVHTSREALILKKNNSSPKEITALKTSLSHTIDSFISELGKNSAVLSDKLDIIAVFSSPWYFSQTKIITVEHKEPFIITADYLESLEKKEVEAVRASANNADKKTGAVFEKDSVVDSKILRVRLNGYKCTSPIGKRVQTIEIAIVITIYPKAVLETLKDCVAKFHRVHSFNYFSFSLVGFSVIRDTFPDIHNSIFAEIGGEVTDVTISKNELILETISLPVGSHTLNRQISEELNVLPDIAQSYLSLNSESLTHQKLEASIEKAHEKAKITWTTSFKNALTEFSQEIFLPRSIFLISEHGTGDFFLDIIKKTEFHEIAFNNEDVDARLLSSRTLSTLVPYNPDVRRDSFISLLVFFRSQLNLSR